MTASVPYLPVPLRAEVKPDRLRSFVDEHYDRLWRVLRRLGVPLDAVEDAAQEVLLVLARRLPDVRRGAEWAFVYETARRIAADARRRESTREREGDAAALSAVPDPSGDRTAALDGCRLLDALLRSLPNEQREVVVLVEIEGMTMAEAAALLGVPPGTIASRLRRARAHLEDAVRQMGPTLRDQGWFS